MSIRSIVIGFQEIGEQPDELDVFFKTPVFIEVGKIAEHRNQDRSIGLRAFRPWLPNANSATMSLSEVHGPDREFYS